MAVTNDHIRPPITIQNRRNKQTFDTYAYTIDLVPLIFKKSCFAGLIFKYKWKTKQKAQIGKRKAEKRKGAKQKPTYKPKLGQAPPRKQPRPSQ